MYIIGDATPAPAPATQRTAMSQATIDAAYPVLQRLAGQLLQLAMRYAQENEARFSSDGAREFDRVVTNQYRVAFVIATTQPRTQAQLQRGWEVIGAANNAFRRESEARRTHGDVWSAEVVNNASRLWTQAAPVVEAVADAAGDALALGAGALVIAAVVALAVLKKG
jgi:hypothetical protein